MDDADQAPTEYNPSPEEIWEFEEYLRTTLVPDLMGSGFIATADDFQKAAKIIRALMQFIESELGGEDDETEDPPSP